MSKINIRVYKESDFDVWNDFISKAKNGTFLFHRNFMEYHKERFRDFSLLIYNNKSKLIAVLPAHIKGETVYSHQGLTYGGIVIKAELRMTVFFEIFSEVLKFLNQNKVLFFYCKEIPYFYNSLPNDEWKYLAFITDAELYRRDLCSVVDLKKKNFFSKSVVRYAKRCEKQGFTYRKCEDWEMFWNEILIPELFLHHNVLPVHDLEEISYLQSKFQDNIHLYCVFSGDEMAGGTVLFIDRDVVHCQYISAKTKFRKNKVLDFLYFKLISEDFKKYNYFDFGISNEEDGRKTNMGLLYWKEGFGARGVVQDFYKISTQNYSLIKEMYL